MRAIVRALVDEVWRDMTGYAPARIASEAQVFLELQPHAAAFSQAVTSAFDPTVQKAARGLAFLLFNSRRGQVLKSSICPRQMIGRRSENRRPMQDFKT